VFRSVSSICVCVCDVRGLRAVKALSYHLHNTTAASLTCMPAIRPEPKAFMCENRDAQQQMHTKNTHTNRYKTYTLEKYIHYAINDWFCR